MRSIPVIRYIPVVNDLTDKTIDIMENALELMFGAVETNKTPVVRDDDVIMNPTHTQLVTLIAEEMMEMRRQLTARLYPEPDGIRKALPYWWDSKEGQWLAAPDGVYFNHHLIDNLDVLERDAYVMLAACQASRTLAFTTTSDEDKELFELNRPNLEMLEMARDASLIVGAYGTNGSFWTWGTVQGWNDDQKLETIVIKTTDEDLIPVPGNRILISDKSVDVVAEQVRGESTSEG